MIKSDGHSTPDRRARVRDAPGETLPCTPMAPGAVKSVVVAMSSQFPFKLYLWGYQTGGTIPSVANQNCRGISPDYPRDESQIVCNSSFV